MEIIGKSTLDDSHLASLKKEILAGFHKQFAENQRFREQSFLRILGFLGTVILGYAYVYLQYSNDLVIFSFVLLTAEIILSAGASIITVIFYNFRRDQYVNSRIRKECNLLGAENSIFPQKFDPKYSLEEKKDAKFNFFNWMPDLLFFMYLLFPIFQMLVLISFVIRANVKFNMNNINWLVTTIITLSLILIMCTIYLSAHYYHKTQNYFENY